MIYNGTNVTIKLTEQGVNLHNPTSADIYYKKPNGVTGSWGATVIANHEITYTTTVGDIDVPGVWILQGFVVKAGVTYKTSIAQMIVEASL
jgi:phenylalanyl-tRNA synthetase beta subunit